MSMQVYLLNRLKVLAFKLTYTLVMVRLNLAFRLEFFGSFFHRKKNMKKDFLSELYLTSYDTNTSDILYLML